MHQLLPRMICTQGSSSYITLAIIITIKFSVPNYVPALVQSFSLYLELRYALPMSHVNISKSFKDASRNSILTLYLDITLDCTINDCGDSAWPPDNNPAYMVNFQFILM